MNTELFKEALIHNHISQAEVSRRIGICSRSLSQKALGKQDFWLREIRNICEILSIEDPRPIFFSDDKAECRNTPPGQ